MWFVIYMCKYISEQNCASFPQLTFAPKNAFSPAWYGDIDWSISVDDALSLTSCILNGVNDVKDPDPDEILKYFFVHMFW